MAFVSSTKAGKSARAAKADMMLIRDIHADIWRRPGFLIRRLHQIGVAIFLDGMAELGLTPLQFGALTIIATSPGIEQSALGEQLGIDRVNAGDIIKRLITQGLATRDIATHDRRFKNVFLTPAGVDLAAAGVKKMGRISDRLLGPLGAAEREVFLELLQKLVEGNNAYGRTFLKLPDRPKEVGRSKRPAQAKKSKDPRPGGATTPGL